MKYKKCEYNACDFCIYYDFNGDSDGCYTGNGYCRKLKKLSEPFDFCKYFICAICNPKIKVRKNNERRTYK